MAIIDSKSDTKAKPQEAIKQMQFGIGDARFIQQILRSDVYSNKPRIIVQGYLSNARDAHREAKNALLPIDVHLPTTENPKLVIRDYGPGVDPERFEKVFVKYGTSTKRDSNKETGGFGIGAKSAWAYTDEYFVTSWVPENDTIIERRYRCYIANDGWCYGALEYENENSSEKPGTEVSLFIRPEDIEEFHSNFHNITYFWGVRPNLLNDYKIHYENWNKTASGENWTLFERYNGIRNGPVAIIDGIPYAVLPEELGELDEKMNSLLSYPIHFHAETGEVSIALNRESLTYNNHTKNYLKEKLQEVIDDMTRSVESEIENLNSFWLAECYWADNIRKTPIGNIIKSVNWNGVPVGQTKYNNAHFPDVIINKVKLTNEDNTHKPKITMRRSDKLYFEKDHLIVINDTDKSPSPNRMLGLFGTGENKKYNNAFVITFRDNPDAKKVWWEDLNLKHMNPLYTSNFEKWKAKKGGPKKPRKKLCIKRMTAHLSCGGWVNSGTIDVNLDEKNDTGFYLKTYNGRIIQEDKREPLDDDMLKMVKHAVFHFCPNHQVYLVPAPFWNRVKRDTQLKPAYKFLKDNVKEYVKNTDINSLLITREAARFLSKDDLGAISYIMEEIEKRLPQEHLFNVISKKTDEIKIRCQTAFEEINKYTSLVGGLPEIKGSIDDHPAVALRKEFKQRYPLLDAMSDELYGALRSKDSLDAVLDYINTMDSKKQ